MSLKSFLIAVAAAATLGGCINTNVSYSEILREDQTFNWNVTQINVNVPRSLTTTDRNGQAPNVDIIWIEEGPGDTYLQVQRIFEEGVALGAGRLDASLKGGRSVRLEVEVAQFHTLTRRARPILAKHSRHGRSSNPTRKPRGAHVPARKMRLAIPCGSPLSSGLPVWLPHGWRLRAMMRFCQATGF